MNLDTISLRHVRMTVTPPAGEPQPFGKVNVIAEAGGPARFWRRGMEHTGDAALIERPRAKAYRVTLTDGTVWDMTGCGCGA